MLLQTGDLDDRRAGKYFRKVVETYSINMLRSPSKQAARWPGPLLPPSGGPCSHGRGVHNRGGAARCEGAARRQVVQRWHLVQESQSQPLNGWAQRRAAPRPAVPADRDAADRRTDRRPCLPQPCGRRASPIMRSATSATTPRSCVIIISAVPSSSPSSRIRSRICAWMVTSEGSGGLVGDQQARPAGQRHGDQRALPHAAGHLMRVL